MLVTLNDVLPKARREGYAVGLFNTVNLEMAKGVLAAAEELRAPVIIGTAEVLLPSASLEDLASILRPLAEKASVPVVLHFDHGLREDTTKRAIELGFSSVMYDCSTLDFDGNLRAAADMAAYAHAHGCSMEAELGHVGTGDVLVPADTYTVPEDAVRFCEATGCDALAIAVGTSHGAYKFKPKLDFERISTICGMVPQPLVLHGGSGLSDEDFREAIRRGISKVNIFTDLNCAAAKAAHDAYREGIGLTDVMPRITEAVKAATMKKMSLFGCAGRA
ncbi:MAG: ketose-bisphosphate aldolase [Eubacteriales bacterium]